MVNNTEELRLWFRDCPVLSPDNRFRIDYLSERPCEYAIYSSPSPISYHENVLGESIPDRIQSLNFIFASKAPFGADVDQNLSNLAFFQAVVEWVIEKNNQRQFPLINEGTVKSIIPTLTAYPAETGSDAAKYQIQLKMTYYRRNDS